MNKLNLPPPPLAAAAGPGPAARPAVRAGPIVAAVCPARGRHGSRGVLAGVAQGAEELGMAIHHDGVRRFTLPVLRDETFVVDVGALVDGDELELWVIDENGNVLATGTTVNERAKVRPVGATATDR